MIIGIVRLVGVIKLFYVPQPGKDPYHDITVTLSVVEANVAIVSASGPALRPLFRAWMPTLFGGSTDRYGPNRYTPNPGSHFFTGGNSVATIGGHGGTGTNSAVRRGGGDRDIPLKGLRGMGKNGHSECRSVSPSGSEEEIMTYNGIMRTTDVRVQYGEGASTIPPDQSSRASSDLKPKQSPAEKVDL